VAQFILVEYVEDEKSYFAEWFTGLNAASAARNDEGRIVLLLGGGTKRGQSRDIRKAIDRWTTYKERKREP
jgi:hypothetical protein